MDTQAKQNAPVQQPVVSPYEAPRIELILTVEELEREVLYAGTPSVE
jgi:hypothetical protein